MKTDIDREKNRLYIKKIENLDGGMFLMIF